MALKLVRHAGTITVSTMGDDAAHGLELGKLVKGHAIRVNEFGGNDVFINAAEEAYFISVINETAGSDGAVHVEIVAQGNSI